VTATPLDPLACALFLCTAFTLAGLCQASWLSARPSRRFAAPLDLGLRVRGRRLFGGNKTWRGVMVMIPATAAAFPLLAQVVDPAAAGLWPLDGAGYFRLGLVAGAGFMAGELPNSFLKRQLDIPPGGAAAGRWLRPIFAAADRVDSSLGTLLALACVVPVPLATAAMAMALGALLHFAFSALTFRMGGKTRLA
jgi:hypothetical protein